MIEQLFYLLLLLAGIPMGIFLAKLCYEEIKAWKGRLKIMIGVAIILSIGFIFSNFIYKIPTIVALLFIVVVDLTIIKKSH